MRRLLSRQPGLKERPSGFSATAASQRHLLPTPEVPGHQRGRAGRPKTPRRLTLTEATEAVRKFREQRDAALRHSAAREGHGGSGRKASEVDLSL